MQKTFNGNFRIKLLIKIKNEAEYFVAKFFIKILKNEKQKS